DPKLVGADEIRAVAVGFEGEGKGALVEGEIAVGGDGSAVGNAVFVGAGIIAQPAAGEIDGLGAVVVEFEEVLGALVVGVGEDFIDDDGAAGIEADGISRTRRAANAVAGGPGAGVAFAVRGTG